MVTLGNKGRSIWEQDVGGSNPLAPTKPAKCRQFRRLTRTRANPSILRFEQDVVGRPGRRGGAGPADLALETARSSSILAHKWHKLGRSPRSSIPRPALDPERLDAGLGGRRQPDMRTVAILQTAAVPARPS